MLAKLVALSSALASLQYALGRPLSDEELTYFYGYDYMAAPTRSLPQPFDASESLKQAAQKAGIYVGAAINYRGMHDGGDGAQYPSIALSQFDIFTAENECKVRPS